MQVGCGAFDVIIFVLPGPAFRGNHPTSVDIFEIAVGELVSSFGVFIFLIVYPQMPFRVFI
jgi:hypothetical protein